MSAANPQNGAGSDGSNKQSGSTLTAMLKNASVMHQSNWGSVKLEGAYLAAAIIVLVVVML